MTSIDCKVKISPLSVRIVATICGEDVGSYRLNFLKGPEDVFVDSFLDSFRSGVGVPRALIGKACEVLQQIATESGTTVMHNEIILTDEDEKKLRGLFVEQGYYEVGGFLRRNYLP